MDNDFWCSICEKAISMNLSIASLNYDIALYSGCFGSLIFINVYRTSGVYWILASLATPQYLIFVANQFSYVNNTASENRCVLPLGLNPIN